MCHRNSPEFVETASEGRRTRDKGQGNRYSVEQRKIPQISNSETRRESMNMDRARQVTYFLLRVVAGLLFFQAGGMKLLGWFGGIPPEMGGQPPLLSQMGIGGALEFFGEIGRASCRGRGENSG